MNRTVFCLSLLLLPLLAYAQPDQFLRFVPGESQWQGELQTAITRYCNSKGQQVDLIAAIHIADRGYYKELEIHFDSLDSVLYELVADQDQLNDSRAQQSSASGLSLFQTLLANFLSLEFQLGAIDYGRANFRHADLSASELQQIMQSKDESFLSMFLSLAIAQMEQERQALANDQLRPSALTMMSLISALSSENQSQAIKFLIAEELGRSGGLMISPELEAELTILGDRNRAALDVLADTLAQGVERIGLFYGAAHMAGMDRHLRESMGFELVSQQWLTAWNIP